MLGEVSGAMLKRGVYFDRSRSRFQRTRMSLNSTVAGKRPHTYSPGHDQPAILSQGGGSMTLAVRIISPVMLASLLGCASQTAQMSQPVAEKTQRGTTQKTGDANDHLSWLLHRQVSGLRFFQKPSNGCSPTPSFAGSHTARSILTRFSIHHAQWQPTWRREKPRSPVLKSTKASISRPAVSFSPARS
jgi:hypothetical protein